jgi:hypothetical protein
MHMFQLRKNKVAITTWSKDILLYLIAIKTITSTNTFLSMASKTWYPNK